jgi:[glutamine synthetase] adenylyltransferase / [glutamine synthetase]-adenylyl-L-tyrosine phosphorylase
VARDQWQRRTARHGTPVRPRDGRRNRWAILGLGKFGGRELNYHSDLDLVFLHEEDGKTSGGRRSVSNDQFVTEVAQRVLKALQGNASTSPLYQVDTRLRPHGASGPLVVTLSAFQHYFEHSAQSWERLALTRARVIFATGEFGHQVSETIRSILTAPVDPATLGPEVLAMRRRLEESRGRNDLKRGIGGLADLEFIVQYLMLIHTAEQPDLLRTNVWEALDALFRAAIIPVEVHTQLRAAYDFLRTVEGRLRLFHNRGGADLPDNPPDLTGLARRLNYDAPDPNEAVQAFLADAARHTSRSRAIFEQFIKY